MFQEAVDVCHSGLAIHPTYLSARVTLGRSLVELGAFDEAQQELERVLQSAPENLAAIRGLADVLHRRGALVEALAQYRAALAIAKHDPDLEQTVADLARNVEPKRPAHATDGLSFEQVAKELAVHAPAPPPAPITPEAAPPVEAQPDDDSALDHGSRYDRETAMIAALEQFLDAVHVVRADRRA